MISRRKFIAGAGALTALLSQLAKVRASSGVTIGAIRWDPWYAVPPGYFPYEGNLGPDAYQYRAPWFCTPHPADGLIDCAGDRQLVIDLEIQWAAAAGLKFWAFDQYAVPGSDAGIMNAWQFYQQSVFNSQINWCMLAISDSLFGSTGNYTTQVNQYVAWFQQSNYQKVLADRPLLFLFFTSVQSEWGNNNSNFASMISALRTATTTAGLGSPYIVVMSAGGLDNYTFQQAIGADAISGYVGPSPGVAGASYSALVSSAESFWSSMAAKGVPIIPNGQMGWDTRPRSGSTWVYPGTVAQRAAHMQDLVNFIKNNPSVCAANVGIVYSWTECDEGGGALIPTIGDPPPGPPPALNGILSAIAPIIS